MSTDVKDDDPQKGPQSLSKRVMHFTTSAIMFGNIAFGCCINAFAPVLDHMAWRYGVTIAEISIVFTVVKLAYCIGAIICGLISKHINRQLIVILSLFVMASSMFMTPYCSTKLMFFLVGGVMGFSNGFFSSSQMVWIIEIWQTNAGPFIQAQNFCYSVGTIIPSVVLAPFLNENINQTMQIDTNAIDPAITEPSLIHIPFFIIGSLNLLAFLYQLLLFTFYRYHTPPMYDNENLQPVGDAGINQIPAETDLKENVASKQEAKDCNTAMCGISTRKIQLVAFAMLFVGAYQPMELSIMQFLPVFGQYSDLQLTQSAAAHVLTGLMIMYAAGRLLGIIIIFKVRAEVIIIVNLILITAGNTILLIWASGSVTMFWIGSMILGAGLSTMFPSLFTYIEKHLIITAMFASCIMVFSTGTSAMYPVILGKTIAQRAIILTYTTYASTLGCVIAMVWGYSMTRKTVARE